MTRIMAVEDNKLERELLKNSIDKSFEVMTVESSDQFFEQVYDFSPSIIILDIMLPGMNGYQICEKVKLDPKLKDAHVLMLSSKTDPDDRIESYKLGAVNYLEKPFVPAELNAILIVLKAMSLGSGDKSKKIEIKDLIIDLTTQEVFCKGEKLTFTSSEFKVLVSLSKVPGVIYSRDKLLQIVVPDKADITDRTIDNHVSSLRKKIRSDFITIKTVYGQGYKLVLRE